LRKIFWTSRLLRLCVLSNWLGWFVWKKNNLWSWVRIPRKKYINSILVHFFNSTNSIFQKRLNQHNCLTFLLLPAKKTAKQLPWKSSENIGRPTIKQNPPKNYNKCRLHEQISTIITTFDQNWPVCSSINIIGLRTFREARILKNSSKYRLMFQQSIPRLFPDSDIATYHWPFILIDEQTGQFWSKVVINLIQNRNWKFENCDWFFLINQKVRILNQRRKFINSNLAEISYCSIQIA
jgi:hypothetical protein